MRSSVLAHGPQVALETVATVLNVTAPALLKRFGSRQALMLAALRPEEPRWVNVVMQGPGSGTLEDQLVDMFTGIASFMHESIPCLMALRESGLPHDQIMPNRKAPAQSIEAVRHWLECARDQGMVTASEIDAAAYAIVGAIQTRAVFAHLMQRKVSKRDQYTYVTELARFFSRALAAPAPAAPRKAAKPTAKKRVRKNVD